MRTLCGARCDAYRLVLAMNSNLTFQVRLLRIDQILHDEGEATSEHLQQALQCSLPTLKRDLTFMRDELGAPVRYDRRKKVYRYESANKKRSFHLPAWYSPTEVKAFFTALMLFDGVEKEEGAMLAPEMKVMKARLMSLAVDDTSGKNLQQFLRRVRVVNQKTKLDRSPWFELIGCALMQQRRLNILYIPKSRAETATREISPVRLINYHNRWYLQAWCHLTDALKTFNLECIRSAEILDKACKACDLKTAEEEDASFGIFSGGELKRAEILFDETVAPFVRSEVWHRDQVLEPHEDGSVTLVLPYRNVAELMDLILSYGEHAEVVNPPDLRREVKVRLEAALKHYEEGR